MFVDGKSLYEKPCKEIFKLKHMLEKADIPFIFIDGGVFETELLEKSPELCEHYAICYPTAGEEMRISVIEGFGTHGREKDRLEIMGGLTPWEQWEHGDSVIGYLTANNVFKRIKKDWEERLMM